MLNSYLEDDPNHPFGLLAAELQGNMGYVFTNGDLGEVRPYHAHRQSDRTVARTYVACEGAFGSDQCLGARLGQRSIVCCVAERGIHWRCVPAAAGCITPLECVGARDTDRVISD